MKTLFKKIFLTLFMIMFLFAINSCGQTGPLYLPKKPPATEVTAEKDHNQKNPTKTPKPESDKDIKSGADKKPQSST